MAFKSTNIFFDAIEDHLRTQMNDQLDEVTRFDGLLSEAVAYHLSKNSQAKSWLFYGFGTDAPDRFSGGGSRIDSVFLMDFVIVLRTAGKSKYNQDIRDVTDISDAIIRVFDDHSKWTQPMMDNVRAMALPVRTRQRLDAGVYAHLVRFEAKPAR